MKPQHIFLVIIVAIINFITVANATASICTWFRGSRTETWNGDNEALQGIIKRRKHLSFWQKREKQFTSTENCPPYNKYGGRRGCLLKFEEPVTIFDSKFWTTVVDNTQTPAWYYAPGYLRYCGEKTMATSYFNPKIRVRHQSCNAIACWHNDSNLSHGDCAVFATSLGIPLLRICARIAIPDTTSFDQDEKSICASDSITNDPLCQYNAKDDPGYTRCYHLNHQGGQDPDKTYDSVDDNCKVRMIAPKLCLYVDPSLTSLSSLLDPFDYNPVSQPLHSGSQIFPVGKILIELVNAGTSLADALVALVGIVVDKIGLSFLKDVVRFIGNVIQFIGSAFVDILKDVFDLNRVVNPEVLGCVELPLGPLPPPFYNELQKTASGKVEIIPICSKEELNLENKENINVASSQCAVSNIHNNIISNAVRISNSNQLPLCQNGEEGEKSYKANQCVKIQNIELFGPSVIRKKYNDVLKLCKYGNSDEPCVNYNGCEDSDNQLAGCKGRGFRVLYATNIKGKVVDDISQLEPSEKFNYCLPDCVGTRCPIQASPGADSCCEGAQLCQQVYGVDVGNFDDIKLVFQQDKVNEGKNGVVKESIKFNAKDLIALITRTTRPICQELLQSSDSNIKCDDAQIIHEQTSDDICVYNINNTKKPLIGCVKRAAPPLPTAFKCRNSKNNHFKPDIGIKLEVKESETNYSLEGCIEAKHSHHQNRTNDVEDDENNNQFNINLAGYDYNAYVTDHKGSVSPDVGTKWGKYDLEAPKEAQDVQSHNAKYRYLKGIEFINNEYVVGGKLICVNQNSNAIPKCPLDEKMCVLAKVKENPECIKAQQNNNTQQNFGPETCKEVSQSIEDRVYPRDFALCNEESADYPNCFKLGTNEHYQLTKTGFSNTMSLSDRSIKTEEDIMQTIGNCGSETVKSKECVSYSPRKYIYRFNTVQEVLKCKTDHSRCTVNVRSCTNDELMDRANTQLTNDAVKSETALIGLFKTTNNLICSGVIDKVCKDVKYKCQPKFTISDNGTVIDIETCADDASTSENKKNAAPITDFVCSTTKLESCDKLSESKFYTFTNSHENLIRHYNSANLLGELVETKKYVNKLDTKAVLIDPKFCGNRIKQCPENKHCTIFDEGKKFILGDEQEYVIKRCQTQLCYAKTSEDKKVDKDDALVKLPYEGDGKTRFRSKNALELGLCQVIPDMPKCKQEESYNAIWPETSSGEEAIGQCKKGPNPRIKYIPIDKNSLKRRCLFDPAIDANSNVHFTSGDTAKPVFELPKKKKEVGCKEYKVKCSKISENGVIWPAVEVDATSQPKCVNSAYKLSNPNATRKCELDHKNNPVFTKPTANVTCSHPDKCDRLVDTKNGVIWSEAKVREISRPTCVNKNHKLSHPTARRKCVLDNKGGTHRLELNAMIDTEDPITRGHRIKYISASDVTCYDPNKCSEVLENGIIWSEAEVGKKSHPRCENPDYKVSNSLVTRMCLDDNGVPKLASTVSYSLYPIGPVSTSVSSIKCLPRLR
ncbi:hypothetical protein [Orientia tsutsugamushi]|uniref:hypothetical protein n=1 Tax=Orientia tsutsugamushi TaxID=784 RepID=UPI003527C368